MVRKPYSRLAKTEEKRNVRQAYFFVFLTIAALIILFIFGLPTTAKFAAFLTELKQSATPIDNNDATPPAPPQLGLLPEATNSLSIEITGRTESGAIVKLFLNNEEKEVLANSDGDFTVNFGLNKGENTIQAQATDNAGNISQKTDLTTVVFDNEAPSLEIVSPEDGTAYYGSKQRQVTIEGQTESDASLKINDRLVVVDSDGSYVYIATLSEGENQFLVKSEDNAGNSVEKSLTLSFSP